MNYNNYTIVKYNSKYYMQVGPVNGFMSGDSYGHIYLLITDLDQAEGIITHIKEVFVDKSIEPSEYEFTYGESLLIDDVAKDYFNDEKWGDEGLIDMSAAELISNYNLNYYMLYNKFANEDIDDISNLCYLYANEVLSKADIENIDFSISTNNAAYKGALEYLWNGKTNAVLASLNLILNYGVQYSSSMTSCGCNDYTNESSISDTTCSDVYLSAMNNLVKNMLSDISYYKDWFFYKDGETYKVNETLINSLKNILEQYKEYIANGGSSTSGKHYECPDLNSLTTSLCGDATTIVDNYIKVLDFILNCEMEANTNKIKIYGSQFADMLLAI